MDYYEELGVGRDASEAEIRQMYRRAVKLFHPDQFQDEDRKAMANRQMIRLNEMLDTLTTAERRRGYDLSLVAGLRTGPQFAANVNRMRHRSRFESKRVTATMFVVCALGFAALGVAASGVLDGPGAPVAAVGRDVQVMTEQNTEQKAQTAPNNQGIPNYPSTPLLPPEQLSSIFTSAPVSKTDAR